MAKKGMHLSNLLDMNVYHIVNCLELSRVCDIALLQDICRLFPQKTGHKSPILSSLRY